VNSAEVPELQRIEFAQKRPRLWVKKESSAEEGEEIQAVSFHKSQVNSQQQQQQRRIHLDFADSEFALGDNRTDCQRIFSTEEAEDAFDKEDEDGDDSEDSKELEGESTDESEEERRKFFRKFLHYPPIVSRHNPKTLCPSTSRNNNIHK